MPSLKRKVAVHKLKRRRGKLAKEARALKRLALDRNKALKAAVSASDLAAAKEADRNARLKKLKADERLEILKSKEAKERRERARKLIKKTKSSLGGLSGIYKIVKGKPK